MSAMSNLPSSCPRYRQLIARTLAACSVCKRQNREALVQANAASCSDAAIHIIAVLDARMFKLNDIFSWEAIAHDYSNM